MSKYSAAGPSVPQLFKIITDYCTLDVECNATDTIKKKTEIQQRQAFLLHKLHFVINAKSYSWSAASLARALGVYESRRWFALYVGLRECKHSDALSSRQPPGGTEISYTSWECEELKVRTSCSLRWCVAALELRRAGFSDAPLQGLPSLPAKAGFFRAASAAHQPRIQCFPAPLKAF